MFGINDEHFNRWDDRLRPTEKTEPTLLPAGESTSVDLVMLFNQKDGFFATASGKYWISGRVYSHGDIVAAPVAIEVREPSGTDRPVWEWLNDHKEVYGRLVQVPWSSETKLSDEFVRECDRICTETTSAYAEYLAYFLSRWYREGPGKDAPQSAEESRRFAEIAKAKASSEKVRAEAEKLLSPHPPGAALGDDKSERERCRRECAKKTTTLIDYNACVESCPPP
jgi:hypothetical protein